MEGIVQNIGNLVPKVSKIQSMCFTLNMNKNKVPTHAYVETETSSLVPFADTRDGDFDVGIS